MYIISIVIYRAYSTFIRDKCIVMHLAYVTSPLQLSVKRYSTSSLTIKLDSLTVKKDVDFSVRGSLLLIRVNGP